MDLIMHSTMQPEGPGYGRWTKTLLIMKLTIVMFLCACLAADAHSIAQSISLSEKNTPLQKVIREIERQSGYDFFFPSELVRKAGTVTVQVTNVSLQEAVAAALKGKGLMYEVIGRTVVIKRQPQEPQPKEPVAAPVAIDVSGIVTDENGIPLAGASVSVKDTDQGATTDKNGQFLLKQVPERAILLVSFVGYELKEVPLNAGRSIRIELKRVIGVLDESVIIGYGTTTRRKSTGSVSSITSAEIAKQPVANPLNALQGRVAGALVTQSNGLPGSRVTIVVRGLNSLDQTGAGSQPLYIIDGVPFNIQDGIIPVTNDLNGRGAFGANGGISPFGIINPAEIERIDILKDADATAIYGTRGANGVVLITTKKGQSGKTKLALNVYKGVGKVAHFIPMMNTQQFREMRKQAYANDGIAYNPTIAPDLYWDSVNTTNWQKKYLGGTANTTDAQATVSGGDQRTRFLLNAGYHKETTVFPGDFDDYRISSRLNVEHNSLDKKFNASAAINYSFGENVLPRFDVSSLYNLAPNLPLYNANGSLFWAPNFNSSNPEGNPEAYLLQKYFAKTNNLMTNTVLRYTLLPGLDIKTSFGFNRISLDQNFQYPAVSKNPLRRTPTDSARFDVLEQKSYILEPQVTYNTDISKGQVSALVGGTFQHSLNTSFSIRGDNYSTPALLGSIAGAGTYSAPSSSYTLYRYNSLFGRLTYDWDSKYILNAVLRRDGSSRFGPGKRFGTFWSVGAGWIFSNEPFMAHLPFLSFGKLRSSYGVTGNDQIGDYLYRTLFTATTAYQGGAALAPSRIDNPSLRWQTTNKLEFGIELGFLKNAVQLTANYYRNRTPNQLGFLSLATQSGFNSYSANFDATIENKGFELELNSTNINSKNFRWTTSFNLTVPTTKVIAASKSYFFYNANSIGQHLSYQFRYQYRGVDPATGRPLFRDAAKDSLTFAPNFSTDRAVTGYTAPKLYGGLNNSITYKNVALSFFFQYTVQDGSIHPLPPGSFAPGAFDNGNQTSFWLSRWQKAGESSTVPKYTTNTSVYSAYTSSNALFGDASFVRLRTVSVSYSFPQKLLGRSRIDDLRVYLQGQNLWWDSKLKYVYDPETGTPMPPLRVVTAGINITL